VGTGVRRNRAVGLRPGGNRIKLSYSGCGQREETHCRGEPGGFRGTVIP
jgi:hypothetical protein